MDGEADSRKTLEMRERRSQRSCDKIEDFNNMDEGFMKGQKDKWQRELTQIEQRETDLLPEHEHDQKEVSKVAESGGQVGREQGKSEEIQ